MVVPGGKKVGEGGNVSLVQFLKKDSTKKACEGRQQPSTRLEKERPGWRQRKKNRKHLPPDGRWAAAERSRAGLGERHKPLSPRRTKGVRAPSRKKGEVPRSGTTLRNNSS